MFNFYLKILVPCLVLVSCENKLKKYDRLFKSASEDLSTHAYDKALTKLNNAIELLPDTIVGFLQRGRLFYETGKYKESKMDFQKALEFNGKSVLAFFYMGLNCAALGQYDSAIQFYNKAYTIKGGGGMVFEINKEGIYGKSFNQDVDVSEIIFYRGIAFYLKNDFINASSDLLYAIDGNFNVGLSYMYLGVMETTLKNLPAGCKYLKLAVDNGEQEAKKYLDERCK